MDSSGLFATLVTLLVAVSSLAASVAALYVSNEAKEFQRQALVSQQVGETLISKYNERPFPQVMPLGEVTLSRYLEARRYALGRLKSDANDWARLSAYGVESAESQIAYHAAGNVTEMGMKVFLGGVPLSVIIPFNASLFVEDWTIGATWVDTFRRHAGVVPTRTDRERFEVPYYRSPGEWLFLIAMLWLMRNWKHPVIDLYLGGRPSENRKSLSRRLRILSRHIGVTLPPRVRREIRMLTGVAV